MNRLRVCKADVLSCHRHPQPVHGYVLKKRWRYLERTGLSKMEGMCTLVGTYTLVVDPDAEEMITLFQLNGAMIYYDPAGNCTGFDGVFTRIAKFRAHHIKVGVGEDYV